MQGPIAGEDPDEYCGPTTVITLMPEGGEPCGRLTKTWTADSGKCCEMPRIVVDEVDNWLQVLADGEEIFFSENMQQNFTVFLPKGADVTVNVYNFSTSSPQTWTVSYRYYIGEQVIDTVSEEGDTPHDGPPPNGTPAYTRSFTVC